MDQLNVYEQYFEADMVYNGRARRAAKVMLICESGDGQIRYEAAVTFFPHEDEEDYLVTSDAYFSKTLYDAKGRRSKARETALMEELKSELDALCSENGAKVFWEKPLREARFA